MVILIKIANMIVSDDDDACEAAMDFGYAKRRMAIFGVF
jgi:hypothetical protein